MTQKRKRPFNYRCSLLVRLALLNLFNFLEVHQEKRCTHNQEVSFLLKIIGRPVKNFTC